MPSDNLLRKLYSGNYEFRVDSASLLRFRVTSQMIIDKLKQLQPSGRALLDIGTGYGTFVEVAISNELDAIGIEPAGNLYRFAFTKLKRRILHTDLRSFVKTNTKQYDFVSAIHVIEHQKEPRKFLETAIELLKPGGVLFIETPNSDSHLANVEKENYTFLTPPDHIHLFSKKSLETLINKLSGNTCSSYYTYSYPEHLVGILRILKRNRGDCHLSSNDLSGVIPILNREKDQGSLPFFDRVVAPLFTPLLNIGNRGSFLQIYIQKKN